MPDIWMDVDTALAEVPVNMMPLIDDTDFKTVEDAIAYDAAGMDLRWNFVTTGGAYTSTAVTPTTGGSYDWTHQGDGMYSIEIPASGGASINNDTEGFGWFSGKITGVLPFRGPVIGFRAAALNDALIDGGDVLAVNAIQISGDSAAADNLEAACDGTGYNLGNGAIVAASVSGDVGGNVLGNVSGSVGSVSGDVGGNVNGNVSGSVGSVSAGVTISGSITTLDGLDSALSSAHGAGSWETGSGGGTDWTADERTAIRTILGIPASGTTPDDPTAGILADIADDTHELQSDWANGGRLDLILDARASQTSVDDLPTNAEFAAAFPANFAALAINASGHVSRVVLTDTLTTYTGNTPQTGDAYAVVSSGTHGNAALKTLIDAVGAIVDAILTDTGTDGVVLSIATRDAIAASLLDLAAGVQTNWTLREALRVILAAAAGKISGADTSTVTIRDPGDTKDRIVASVAASGRTSVTYDKS